MLKFFFVLVIFAGLGLEGYVLYTGNQIAVWQNQIEAGQPVAALGNHPAEYDMLVCRHFDGRQVKTSLYHYAEDEVGGFKRCPLIVEASEGSQRVKLS